MKDNYTTYEVDGRFFHGVYCLNGNIQRCLDKRFTTRGRAVQYAAQVRRSIINGK